MSLILNIDTATEQAGICLAREGQVLQLLESAEQKNHAAFVQPAIEQLLRETGISLASVDAVAVTSGPGSYTGLRVGLASAKGICYALGKPLILINTLEVMAHSAIVQNESGMDPLTLICPMIDARRMEVFTAVYDLSLREIWPPQALIVEEHSFDSLLRTYPVCFTGNGYPKLKGLLSHNNVNFCHTRHHVAGLATLAQKAFEHQRFANLAYSEPFYVKEFFDPSRPAV